MLSPEQAAIEYGPAARGDTGDAARIYLESFPHRVDGWFRTEDQAQRFWRELMELMRLAHGETFFAARQGGRLIGYLILTMPGRSLLPAFFREGFALRVAAHALMGRYGFSPAVIGRVWRSLFAGQASSIEKQLADWPHVYVVAVDRQFTGRGVGSALLWQARAACQRRFDRMWLCVEADNQGAIRLYERFGFRVEASDPTQHVLVWDLSGVETEEQ